MSAKKVLALLGAVATVAIPSYLLGLHVGTNSVFELECLCDKDCDDCCCYDDDPEEGEPVTVEDLPG